MPDTPEILQNQNEVRIIMKPLQENGIEISVQNGVAAPLLPEGVILTPNQKDSLANYFKQITPELAGVNSGSALKIAEALEKYQDDQACKKDMIMYGPSLEDDFAAKRMERLAAARKAVTDAQMNTQPGQERIGAIKAATFARTHLPDMGLTTTINFLKAIK